MKPGAKIWEPPPHSAKDGKPSAEPVPRSVDFICLGRAAVDLYGLERGARLEDAQHFAKYLGGSSGNVAVGLVAARAQGRDADSRRRRAHGPLRARGARRRGRRRQRRPHRPARDSPASCCSASRVRKASRTFSIARTAPTWGSSRRTSTPRPSRRPKALAITGTHLSTDAVRAASRRAIALAKQHGLRVVLDIDYRPVLWGLAGHGGGADREQGSAEVTRSMQAFLPDCDLVVGTEEEIRVAGGGASALEALQAIRARTRATIVMKRGVAGCVVFEGPIPASVDQGLVVGGFPVEVLNVLGAGDAFLSGYLSGWIEDLPAAHCGRRGNAAGAIVVTRHGCTPAMPTRAELEDFMGRAAPPARPDEDARIAALHRATTVRRARGRSLHPRLRSSRARSSRSRPRSRRRLRAHRGFQGAGRRGRARGRGCAASRREPRRHRRRPPRRQGARAPERERRLDRPARSNCPPRARSSSRRRAASGSNCCSGRGTTSSSAW